MPQRSIQPLPEKLQERLGNSDLFLFTSGACHVFARELIRLMPDESFALKRLMMKSDQSKERLLHVFVQSQDYAVDCLGIHRLDDLLAFYHGKFEFRSSATFSVDDLNLNECFEVDLNQASESLELNGPKNRWELFLHPQYIEKTTERAQIVISEAQERYSVRKLLRGKSIISARTAIKANI